MGEKGERRYELPNTLWVPKINDCFQIGVSITNQDFVCLLWGEGRAEVHVA